MDTRNVKSHLVYGHIITMKHSLLLSPMNLYWTTIFHADRVSWNESWVLSHIRIVS